MVAGRKLSGAGTAPAEGGLATLRALPEVFQYTRHALELVWATSRPLTVALALLTLVAGVLPAGIAFVGAKIVDAVVAAIAAHGASGAADLSTVLGYVILEGGLVSALAATQRGLSTCQSLLRAQLGQRVNEMILEKALTLDLRHFEDSEFYDKLTRARREASTRPLALVMSSFDNSAGVTFINNCSFPIWLQQSKIEQFVKEVMDHIGGVLTTSPSTGRSGAPRSRSATS